MPLPCSYLSLGIHSGPCDLGERWLSTGNVAVSLVLLTWSLQRGRACCSGWGHWAAQTCGTRVG